MTNDMKRY